MTLAAKALPRVLGRHNLLLGGEREPVLISALLFGGVAVEVANIISAVICGLFWIASLGVWRWMAKADPQMTRVYQRSLRYRGFYPAYSRPARKM